jgi:putative CocE/NonD family hydrolase
MALLVLVALCVEAQSDIASATRSQARFSQSEIMIPMRDGVKLQTIFFSPTGHSGTLPILFMRSPYGMPGSIDNLSVTLGSLMSDGYIFAFQEIRGRLKSEGHFVMQRPPRNPNDSGAIDESTDAWDSIEWMVKHTPHNNGRVGMLGVSYDAWLATMALLDPHPALKPVSEQATPADMFLGDDFHHNGAFRLSYGFEYAALLETDKAANTNFSFDRADTFQWYLDLGVLRMQMTGTSTRRFRPGTTSSRTRTMTRLAKTALATHIKAPAKVPILHVAGW